MTIFVLVIILLLGTFMHNLIKKSSFLLKEDLKEEEKISAVKSIISSSTYIFSVSIVSLLLILI